MKVLIFTASTIAIFATLLALVDSQTPGPAPDEWNMLMLYNNKTLAATCCQGKRVNMDNSGIRQCSGSPGFYDPNAKCHGAGSGAECNHRMKVIGINWCSIGNGADIAASIIEFNNDCVQGGGHTVAVRENFCSFDNFGAPVDPPPPANTPDQGNPKPKNDALHNQNPTGTGIKTDTHIKAQPGINSDPTVSSDTGEKLPPMKKGAYRYSLADYAITRAVSCCDAADKPHPTFQDYNCTYRPPQWANPLEEQCTKVLTILRGEGPTSDATSEVSTWAAGICKPAVATAQKSEYGYCRLLFDQALDGMQRMFEKACTAFNGNIVTPKNGMCQWDVGDSKSTSQSTTSTTDGDTKTTNTT